MKKLISLLALTAFLFLYADMMAQEKKPDPPVKHGKGFVDKNGDGYNDNAPDDDGDGIPNGIDPDYKGPKFQRNKFVDLDGDGINDNAGKGKRAGKSGYGPGGKNIEPKDGAGTGDGTQTGKGAEKGKGRGFKGGK